MICRRNLVLAAALVLGIGLIRSAAQDGKNNKDVTIEGQVKAGIHKFKLDGGKLYQFEVTCKDFNPQVLLQGGFIQNTADFFKDKNTFRGLYAPPSNKEYTLFVLPNVFGPGLKEGLLDYTVKLKTMELDETPALKKDDSLAATDPAYKNSFAKARHKAFPLQMKKGKTYIIDMVVKDKTEKLDPYLYLESPMNFVAAQDDDGGGFPNARIMFRPFQDGEYRIIASGLSADKSIGGFTLTVRTVKGEK